MSAALDHLAARVGTDPLFLANALAEYARSEGLDDAGLAVALGCAESDLAGLRLCGVPRPERFREDAMRIAARFGIDPDLLTDAVRRGQSLARLRAGPRPTGVEAGVSLAARDADPPAPPDGEAAP